jgi:type VI secretion system protein ImpF
MQRDRLLPSLLDRLTDDQPQTATEYTEFKVMSLRQLRQAVLRDLAWLLNSTSLDSMQDLSGYTAVSNSVINFGVPVLAGMAASGIQLRGLQQRLREVILNFEPRIIPATLQVRSVDPESSLGHNVLSFNINAQLWAQPAPIELLFQTHVNLESGQTELNEAPR